jgi:hypothetical protein
MRSLKSTVLFDRSVNTTRRLGVVPNPVTELPRRSMLAERIVDKLAQLRTLADESSTRTERAPTAVRLVRALGPYRGTGLHDVTATEIGLIAWDAPEPPRSPRFPVSQGLNEAAVAGRKPVIVQDVA